MTREQPLRPECLPEAEDQVQSDFVRACSSLDGEGVCENLRRSYLNEIFMGLREKNQEELLKHVVERADEYPEGANEALNDSPDAVLDYAVKLAIEEPEDFRDPHKTWQPKTKTPLEHLVWLIERAVSASCVRKRLGLLSIGEQNYRLFEHKLRIYANWRARWLVQCGRETADDLVSNALADALAGYRVWNPRHDFLYFIKKIISSHCSKLTQQLLGKDRTRFHRLMEMPLAERQHFLGNLPDTDEFLKGFSQEELVQLQRSYRPHRSPVFIDFDAIPVAVKGGSPEEIALRTETRERQEKWYADLLESFRQKEDRQIVEILEAWKGDPDLTRAELGARLGSVEEYDRALERLQYAARSNEARAVQFLLASYGKVFDPNELDGNVSKLMNAWKTDPRLSRTKMVRLLGSVDAYHRTISRMQSDLGKKLRDENDQRELFGDLVADTLREVSEELTVVSDETVCNVLSMLSHCVEADTDVGIHDNDVMDDDGVTD